MAPVAFDSQVCILGFMEIFISFFTELLCASDIDRLHDKIIQRFSLLVFHKAISDNPYRIYFTKVSHYN